MSATPGLVSVVIAVFNGRQEIEATLCSAFAQEYTPVEVIVVDGGSTDGTQEAVLRHNKRLEPSSASRPRHR